MPILSLLPDHSGSARQVKAAFSTDFRNGDATLPAVNPELALAYQIAQYRKMTGEQRLAIALELHELACAVAREGIKAQHPDATPQDVERLLRQRLSLMDAP
jgi:hypothetical protein